MTYNLTNFTDTTSIVDVIAASNEMVGGWYIGFLYIGIFVVMFMSMKNYQTESVLVVTSFIWCIVGLLLWSLSWIGMGWLWGSVAMLIVSVIYKIIKG